MKHNHLLTALGSAAMLAVGTSQTQAAFTLLDNFDSYDNSASIRTSYATGGVWHSEFDDGAGSITANSNVIDTAKGQSLQTIGGAAWRGAERDITGTDAAVLVDEIMTYFWQVKVSYTEDHDGWDYDFMMGLSPDVSNIDINDAWQDFSVMPFINNEVTTPYINGYSPNSPWWMPMVPDQWYNVWVVIDNDATAPTYDLYYSSGTDAAVVVATDAYWRGSESGIAPGVDLNAIGFMAAGNPGNRILVDNIYYADGEDLSNPVPIPEPASLALMGLGVLAMARRR